MLTASLNNMKNAYYFTELMVTRLGRSGHSLNINIFCKRLVCIVQPIYSFIRSDTEMFG